MQFEKKRKYKIVIAESAKRDIKETKRYILNNFKYREYGEAFTKKIKTAIMQLEYFPKGHSKTDFTYKSYAIYMKPYDEYLLLYTINEMNYTVLVLRIMEDRMNWMYMLKQWLLSTK